MYLLRGAVKSVATSAVRNEDYEAKLRAANINPESYLATDYLNHYNEIVMLMEMLPDMPDLLEDCAAWAPKSYKQHFLDSSFLAKDLAIEAFARAPQPVQQAFHARTNQLDTYIEQTLSVLIQVGAAERGLSAAARTLVAQRIEEMQTMLGGLNRVIHGQHTDPAMGEISAVPEDEQADGNTQTQDEIDKLFD